MDALLVLGSFVGLAVAALQWGRDTRDAFMSDEQRLAGHGLRWNGRPEGSLPSAAHGRGPNGDLPPALARLHESVQPVSHLV